MPPKRAAHRRRTVGRTALAGELLRRFALYDDDPGIDALTEAVERVAHARLQGRDRTREALIDLAAASFAWAETLAPGYPDQAEFREAA